MWFFSLLIIVHLDHDIKMLLYLLIGSTNQLPNCHIAGILKFITKEIRLETYFDKTLKSEKCV